MTEEVTTKARHAIGAAIGRQYADTVLAALSEAGLVLIASQSRPTADRGQIDTLQLAKDIHRHWYMNFKMPCLPNDACVEAADIIDRALSPAPAQTEE